MSFDLVVFTPLPELKDRLLFLAWYEKQIKATVEGEVYDLSRASPALAAWFKDMIETFPPMNGPLAYRGDDDDILDRSTEYNVGSDIIYAGFAWSQGEEAGHACWTLAEKHRLGLLNVSGNSEVYFPDENGQLALIHGKPLEE